MVQSESGPIDKYESDSSGHQWSYRTINDPIWATSGPIWTTCGPIRQPVFHLDNRDPIGQSVSNLTVVSNLNNQWFNLDKYVH
ncbi:hypothetical protein AVEN_120615-1 [Araneus ventricosus]|uniref:Uncharacterized protein n=1 Tax=Araneus ventricosus TaxID=182803 RepID=A0A4Y2QX11_ARAVE|nr:hypothetical protein AVEN_120615-1 [Araneus ventricosus]